MKARIKLLKIPILISLLIFSIIIDNVFYAAVFSGIEKLISTIWIVIFFVILAASYSSVYLLSGFVKNVSVDIRTKDHYFNVIYKILIINQYLMFGILLFMILQILLNSQYNVFLMIAIVVTNFSVSAIILGLLGYKLFSWYKLNKNYVVLLYSLTLLVGTVGLGIIGFINSYLIFLGNPGGILVSQYYHLPYVTVDAKSLILLQTSYMPLRIAFLLIWIASVSLLRQYSKRLGNAKFWSIMILPLFSYLIGSVLVSNIKQENIFFNAMLTIVSLTVGGILFGLAFSRTAKSISKISQSKTISRYLTTSAYGIVLLSVAVTSPIVYAPYPPFGVISWSFLGFSSYLFSLGIYSSAISVSQDVILRKSIRKSAIEESKLLDSIGTAHMKKEMEEKILKLTKDKSDVMIAQSGIQTSLSEDDMKNYLDMVFKEIKKKGEINKE